MIVDTLCGGPVKVTSVGQPLDRVGQKGVQFQKGNQHEGPLSDARMRYREGLP